MPWTNRSGHGRTTERATFTECSNSSRTTTSRSDLSHPLMFPVTPVLDFVSNEVGLVIRLDAVLRPLSGSGSRKRNRDAVVPRLGWPALRTNGVLQPQLARRPLNPLGFAERSAPLDAHPHAPEFLPSRSAAHSLDRSNPPGVPQAKARGWP